MQKLNDLSRCLTPLEPDGTLIAVIEMSLSSWLVAGIVPGVERQPLKKLAVDESVLLKLLHRWREEAEKAGYMIPTIDRQSADKRLSNVDRKSGLLGFRPLQPAASRMQRFSALAFGVPLRTLDYPSFYSRLHDG